MKLFQKQLLVLLVLVLAIVGSLNYYFFFGMSDIIDSFSKDKVYYLAKDTRAFLQEDAALNEGEWTKGKSQALRRRLIEHGKNYPEIENLFISKGDSTILFSFIVNRKPLPLLSKKHAQNGASAIAILKRGDMYQANWSLSTQEPLTASLIVNPVLRISDTKRSYMLQILLISVGAIIGTILVSALLGKGVGTPMRTIEDAMTHIDKRKYGFRIKSKSSDEFHSVYERVNRALMRLEQLDSVQRTAVQKKNSLAGEMRTLFRYLDVMAHEVKNPLHALVINTDVLKTKIQKNRAKTETMKHVKIIELEIEHLKEVVEGFLRYFRPGVPQKEKLQINGVMSDVCKMASAEAEKNKVKIETRLGKNLPNVFVDANQMGQAFHNLIINAIHASPEGSKIFIRTWEKRRKVIVSIKDNGTGIAKEELKKIFELYYTTKKEGSGIGLPVTKRIIETNGGQIQFESKAGKGTTVTVIINTV